jgi:hypothetical protein
MKINISISTTFSLLEKLEKIADTFNFSIEKNQKRSLSNFVDQASIFLTNDYEKIIESINSKCYPYYVHHLIPVEDTGHIVGKQAIIFKDKDEALKITVKEAWHISQISANRLLKTGIIPQDKKYNSKEGYVMYPPRIYLETSGKKKL